MQLFLIHSFDFLIPPTGQVNFLRETKFFVTRVEKIKGTEYHNFYMNELEQ